MDFSGRIAVVSGGASGIGAACVERLRAEGATAVSWDVSGSPDIPCDVTDEASVAAALAETVERYGVPSLHVAGAGIMGPVAPFHEIPVDGWDRVFAVNLRGVFLTMRAVSAAMIKAELDGALIAISSVNGRVADPTIAAYSTTKAGVYHLARVAAVDLGPYGIRVNAIGPGPTATPMLSPLTSTEGYEAEVAAATPLGKLGTPDLIADAVVNVMRSDWITGQAIMADGGSSLMTARGKWRLTHVDGRQSDGTSKA